MRKERVQQCIWGALLAFALAVGGLGCCGTGLELLSGTEQLRLMLWCALGAAVLSFLMNLRLAPAVFPVLLAGLGFCWFHTGLEGDMEQLVYEISAVYHSGYGWPVVSWEAGGGEVLKAMQAISLVLMLPVCSVVNRKGSAWAAVPLSLLPVVSTLVLTDTVPAVGYLFLYLLGVMVLLLTQGTRRRDSRQGNHLSIKSTAVTAAFLALVFLCNPQADYDKQELAEKLQNAVIEFAMKLDRDHVLFTPKNWDDKQIAGNIPDSIDLDAVGPKFDQDIKVMTISGSRPGVVYLRGASFDYYNGTNWESTGQPDGTNQWPRGRNAQRETMTITTENLHSVLYLPYYSGNLQVLEDGRLPNSEDYGAYQLSYQYIHPKDMSSGADLTVDACYTQLPGSTRRWAQPLVEALLPDYVNLINPEAVDAAAQTIAAYVRDSAEYSLKTPSIPKNAGDFVRWFLEESDTGYCVHFASSAVVLLRAAGIPARYVTGYMVSLPGSGQTEVMATDAHAWVEYYLPGMGWMVLETTPAMQPVPQPFPGETEPTDTEPSGPDQTMPPMTTPPATTPPLPVTTPPQATTPPDSSFPFPTETDYRPTHPEQTLPPDTTGPGATNPDGTTVPLPTTDPVEQPADENGQKNSPRDWRWLLWLLIPVVGILLIVLQWRIRVYLRQKPLRKGSTNRKALALWKEIQQHTRLLGQEPPENLLELAQKAKFSQHTLLDTELSQLQDYLTQCQSTLMQRPVYCQLLYRLVYALY